MRIAFDLTPEAVEDFDDLKAKAGIDSNAEVFRNALRLYKWFLDQKAAGAEVIIRNEEDETDYVVQIDV